MAKLNDFCGFHFGNIHSSDLNLIVVSSSNRYTKNLLPDPSDYSVDVPGGDGKYYFGQTYGTREFQINVAFDSVTEPIFRKISQLLACDKLQDLVFDELPYKTYRAKLRSKPDFKYICFTDRETGQRVYKGEGTLTFICYFPYAFGFNKYVVRAADYYKCMMPEDIITNSIEENPYRKKGPRKMLPGIIKDHYNVRPNMNTSWKGGYPTIEQTQWGELYFKAPPSEKSVIMPQDCSSESPNGAKLLIDVRGYWKNIPEWETTAKLLTSPTLDYEQELIFMPQYNKINYINMETGLNNEQGLIGSRILVYNPGDLPVEFELKMDNVKKRFRAEDGSYSFRVNRYNVQRLHIADAVDWTGLKAYSLSDDELYKYGNRYFKILEQTGQKVEYARDNDDNPLTYNEFNYRLLKNAHPNHCYIVEPVPRQRLGHFIKVFYWQSYQLGILTEEEWHRGIDFANRYEEMYKQCITEEEIYELYWDTLKRGILFQYKKMGLSDDQLEDLIYNYIHHPPEYIKINKDWEEVHTHKYGQFDFNLSRLPSYITEDYFQLNSDKLFDDDVVEPSEWDPYEFEAAATQQKISHSLFLDTERRMLYNINEPEWSNNLEWFEENPEQLDNFYNYKPTKTIRNEAIEQGHWFKLPPGWSLISIEPIIDENRWGGKLWKDARPFDWGTSSEQERAEFYSIYEKALRDYLSSQCPQSIIEKFGNDIDFQNDELYKIENYAQFRRWYGEDEDFYGDFNQSAAEENSLIKNFDISASLTHKMNEDAEYGFLKTLASYWNIAHIDEKGKVASSINDWWWKANSYIWANFPPLYWGYMDLLNSIIIKYVPLFY